MKNINFLYWILAAMLFVTSCQDDDQELGRMLDKSEIDFEVVQDFNADPGGNTVILKNNTAGTVSIWDYVIGRSNRAQDTVRFAFKGDYEINFSVMTAGGIVEMDPVTINVTEDNLSYVNDPLWTFLTGGVGNEKTWILDNGKYGLAPGPVSYADASREQVWDNYVPNWEPGPSTSYGNYEAAEMTFKLIGGPFIETVKPNEDTGNESGTFFLNVNTHTLSTTDATIVRPANFIPNASNWNNNLNVLELTENQLRVAVFRTNSEGPWWYILNYVSKEYAENYVHEEPQPDEGFNPTFAPGELLNMLTGGPSSGRIWEIDAAGNPVDWLASGRGWTTGANSSYNWGWNDDWISAVADSWIRFDRFDGQNYSRYQNGVLSTGTFTINEATNEITLIGNTLLQNPGHWMSPTANVEGNSVIKVVKAFNDDFQTKGIWFGTSYTEYDNDGNYKDEWLTFHYIIPQ